MNALVDICIRFTAAVDLRSNSLVFLLASALTTAWEDPSRFTLRYTIAHQTASMSVIFAKRNRDKKCQWKVPFGWHRLPGLHATEPARTDPIIEQRLVRTLENGSVDMVVVFGVRQGDVGLPSGALRAVPIVATRVASD